MSWLWGVFSSFLCLVITYWKPDIVFRAVETEVSSIYIWKWTFLLFFCLAAIAGVRQARGWLALGFVVAVVTFSVHWPQIPLAWPRAEGGGWFAGGFFSALNSRPPLCTSGRGSLQPLAPLSPHCDGPLQLASWRWLSWNGAWLVGLAVALVQVHIDAVLMSLDLGVGLFQWSCFLSRDRRPPRGWAQDVFWQ